MFALITLATGRSFHMDFGTKESEPSGLKEAAWGMTPDLAPEQILDTLLDATEDHDRTASVARALRHDSSHDLPSLARLDPWQRADIRAAVAQACAAPREQTDADLLSLDLPDDERQAKVATLLASDRWLVLAGYWLCPATDLMWAGYTPRNSDEMRVRAHALLGIEGHAASAAEGVPFLTDDLVSMPARLRLVEAMGRSKVAAAVPRLVKMLDDPDIEMQREVVIALGRIGRSAAREPLLGRWQAQSGGSLQQAIRDALRGLSSVEGADYLSSFVETGSAVMVEHGVFIDDSLRLKNQLPKEWLLPLLASPELEARRDAALLLAAFGDETDAPSLRQLAAGEPDGRLKTLAQRGAENLARSGRRKPVELTLVAGDEP